MLKKVSTVIALILISLTFAITTTQAATITVCSFDQKIYNQGETGYVTVTIYNEENDKIRITELTAGINYHYIGGDIYMQTFFTNTTLPVEIPQGQSHTLFIYFTLPTNIAPGYTTMYVRADTELWNSQVSRWYGSDYPGYEPTLYIESPFKGEFEGQQAINEELMDINRTTTSTMWLLGSTTVIFAAVIIFLVLLMRRTRAIPQPAT